MTGTLVVDPSALRSHAADVRQFVQQLSDATGSAADTWNLQAFGVACMEAAQVLQAWTITAKQSVGRVASAGDAVADAVDAMASQYAAFETSCSDSFKAISPANPLDATGHESLSAGANFGSVDQGFAGAGIFADAEQTICGPHDWLSVSLDVAADGMDLLGLVTDPFATLVSSAVGWIIEHIGPLKELMDLVAGDPDEVRSMSQTWTNVATAMDTSSSDYQRSAQAVQEQFQGASASAYERAAGQYAHAVAGGASHCKDAAQAFEIAAAAVGTVRGIIRDLLSQFAADALWTGLVALANSAWTFGSTIAAWIVDMTLEGVSLGARIMAKITKLVEELKAFVGMAEKSAHDLEDGTRALEQGANSARRSEQSAASADHASAAHGDGATPHDPHGGGDAPPAGGGETTTAAGAAPGMSPSQLKARLDHAQSELTEKTSALTAARNTHTAAQASLSTTEAEIGRLQRILDDAPNYSTRVGTERKIARLQEQADSQRATVSQTEAQVTAAQSARNQAANEVIEARHGPEVLPPAAEHGARTTIEVGRQGVESGNDAAENDESAPEKVDSMDDGSLVGG